MTQKLKTKSIWGLPNPSFFKFLDTIETRRLPKTLCILGCSDGKFVIHAAKRGFKVFAVEMDKVALYGGVTEIAGKPVKIQGLMDRLRHENVEKNVEVFEGDFLSTHPSKTFSGVFTSGSIHYAENTKYSLKEAIDGIKSYVSLNGILFIEYIHKSEIDSDPHRYFLTKTEIAQYFNADGWDLFKHTTRTYTESPNPRVPFTHKIVWGYLYAFRKSY